MPRPNRFQKDAPKSLRPNNHSPEFTDEQMLLVACFIASVAQVGHGIYVKANAEGNSLRVKIYTDDDTYQDNVHNQEDVQYVLSDYARQLKSLPVYEALLAAVNRGAAEKPQEPRKAPKA